MCLGASYAVAYSGVSIDKKGCSDDSFVVALLLRFHLKVALMNMTNMTNAAISASDMSLGLINHTA